MRRLTLILLTLTFAASACFGTTGSWRCANGAPCAFTPGVGAHCPGVKPVSRAAPGVVQSTSEKCSRCRPQAAPGTNSAAPGHGESACRGCRCEFRVLSSIVPGTTTAAVHNTPTFVVVDHPVLLAPIATPTVGFTVRSVVFTTGPP